MVKDKNMAARYTKMADMYEAGSRGSVDVDKSLRLGESAGARVAGGSAGDLAGLER